MEYFNSSINNRKKDTPDEFITHIINVSSFINSPTQFINAAKYSADIIGKDNLEILPCYLFRSDIEKPSNLIHLFNGLGEWLHVKQISIFEIIYCFKEHAIPLLYNFAFQKNDRPQHLALRTLCRFVIDGIKSDEVITDLLKNIRCFKHENFYPSLYCISQLKNSAITDIFENYFDELKISNPQNALYVLNILTNINTPAKYMDKLEYLKSIVTMEIPNSHISQQFKNTRAFFATSYAEKNQIRAALLYYKIDTTNKEINSFLQKWSKTHNNEKFRKDLSLLCT